MFEALCRLPVTLARLNIHPGRRFKTGGNCSLHHALSSTCIARCHALRCVAIERIVDNSPLTQCDLPQSRDALLRLTAPNPRGGKFPSCQVSLRKS